MRFEMLPSLSPCYLPPWLSHKLPQQHELLLPKLFLLQLGKEILNSIFRLVFEANNHTLRLMGLGTCWVAWGYPGLLRMLSCSSGLVQDTG